MEELIKFDIWYGTVEIEQRPLVDSKGFGFESRRVWRDRNGVVQKVDGWQPPMCRVFVLDAPAKRAPWWARLLGAA